MMTSVRKRWRPDLAVDALFPWRGRRVPAVGRRRALAAGRVDATHPQPERDGGDGKMSWLEQEESPAAAVSLVPLVEKPIALPLLLLLHLLVLVHVQVPRPPSLLTAREAATAEDGDDLEEEKRRVESDKGKNNHHGGCRGGHRGRRCHLFHGEVGGKSCHLRRTCSDFSSTIEVCLFSDSHLNP